MMERLPLVSVIVPVYRTEPYLTDCVSSLLAQTYSNLEILLVDDGSPDRSGELCDQFARKDARIRVIHKSNGGVSSARNAGLDAARGDFVSFVDSDDTLEPDTYAYLIEQMQKHDADVAMFEYSIDYPDRVIEHSHKAEGRLQNREQAICATVSPANRFCCSKIFARRLIEGVRFDPQIRVGEDTLFCVKAMLACERVYYSDRVLYHYRQNVQSVTGGGFHQGYLSVIEAYEQIYALCAPISVQAEHTALASLAEFYALVLHGLRHCDFDRDRALYKQYRAKCKAWLTKIVRAKGVSYKVKLKVLLCCHLPCVYTMLKRIKES